MIESCCILFTTILVINYKGTYNDIITTYNLATSLGIPTNQILLIISMHTVKAATCHGGPAVHDLQIQHMRAALLLCSQQLRVFLVPTAPAGTPATGRRRACEGSCPRALPTR